MDKYNMEFEDSQLTAVITEELGAGYGKIAANNILNNEQAQESAQESIRYIQTVEVNDGCGCVDGRCVIHTIDGKESKVGPKTIGGIAISTLFASELAGIFDDRGDVYSHLVDIINRLEDSLPGSVRFHIDADNESTVKQTIDNFRVDAKESDQLGSVVSRLYELDAPNQSGCGMDDQMLPAFSNMSSIPRKFDRGGQIISETDQQVKERLLFIKNTTRAIEGDEFSEINFDAHVKIATELSYNMHFEEWNSLKVLLLADWTLRQRGEADGIYPRLEVLKTTDEGVHGHIEDLVGVNKRPNTSLNQTSYVQQAKKMMFWYDQWLANTIADSVTDNTTKQKSLSQAVTEANVAGTFQLIDGSQRAVIYT